MYLPDFVTFWRRKLETDTGVLYLSKNCWFILTLPKFSGTETIKNWLNYQILSILTNSLDEIVALRCTSLSEIRYYSLIKIYHVLLKDVLAQQREWGK